MNLVRIALRISGDVIPFESKATREIRKKILKDQKWQQRVQEMMDYLKSNISYSEEHQKLADKNRDNLWDKWAFSFDELNNYDGAEGKVDIWFDNNDYLGQIRRAKLDPVSTWVELRPGENSFAVFTADTEEELIELLSGESSGELGDLDELVDKFEAGEFSHSELVEEIEKMPGGLPRALQLEPNLKLVD
jgi:hypothetical protein